jgi:hypothetical protein
VFSKEELAQLRGFPEITGDELIRFFTLTPADRALVDPGRGRSPRDRLSWQSSCVACCGWGSCPMGCGYDPDTAETCRRIHNG